MRLDSNLKILEILKEYVITNKDTRFCQALVNLGIVDRYTLDRTLDSHFSDEFYTESDRTLENVLYILENGKTDDVE